MAGDASVLARTDVRSGGHRAGYPIHLLVVGDDSRSIAAPVTRDLANAFPGLCLDRVDGIGDLAEYGANLRAGAHVLMGLATSVSTSAAEIAIVIALGCSLGMCLPISTPPNAIAYSTGTTPTRASTSTRRLASRSHATR